MEIPFFSSSSTPSHTASADTGTAAQPTLVGPIYTNDWFSHNIPNWTHLFHLVDWDPEAPGNVGIEIGSYEGRSSAWLLENQFRHSESKLFCVDVFADADQPDSYWRNFKNNVVDTVHGHRVEVYKGFSFDFMSKFVSDGRTCDFVYVDGSHRAADVLEDLVLGFRALRPGGLLICDDYLGGAGSNPDLTLGSPKAAVDAFTTIYRDRLELLHWGYQAAVAKKINRSDDDRASRGK